jgi:uncharacterized membrane protein
MNDNETSNLIAEGDVYMARLKEIVDRSIEEEHSIMNDLHKTNDDCLTTGQRIADKVAAFGGSWKFIIIFSIVLFAWICFNVLALQSLRFDPYPFILMNLVLSCEAAMQAPVIMMSQNRQEEKDRKERENDYMINLKAEMQIRSLHEKMDVLEEQQIKTLFESQGRQFELLNEIDKKLDRLLASRQ